MLDLLSSEMKAEQLARARVPTGWVLGLTALYFARPSAELFALGIAVAAVGEALRLWAAGHLEKNERLATNGPYARTRNPLYFGSLWVGVGFVLATGRPELAVLLGLLFFVIYLPVMRREAARLREAFPDTYPSYEAAVPLFLPRLQARRASNGDSRFSWSRVRRNREHVTVLGVVAVAAILAARLALG